ncbi:hypothetical protein GpartN1_g3783.t1 [Galdieria partita]|uniref:Uncharacterized protein n=1 Tax=Galdieria partita TaxID=83374 RepID=A0A9C7UQZ8_9RHOD|nr:hypothetical protein GpartN1_g3783.t1 [Galdieria partita]
MSEQETEVTESTQQQLRKEQLQDWLQQSVRGLGVGLSGTFVLFYRGVEFLHNKANQLVDQHKDVSTSEVAKNSLQGFYSSAQAIGMIAYLGAQHLFPFLNERKTTPCTSRTSQEPK